MNFTESPLQNGKSGLVVYTHQTAWTSLGREIVRGNKIQAGRQAGVASGSSGSQGGNEESHCIGWLCLQICFIRGKPTANIFSTASDNPPKAP